MPVEQTLIFFKPDCFEKQCLGVVLSRFEHAGFTLCASKMLHPSEALLTEHYAHIRHLPHFKDIITFIRSRPILAIVLQRNHAVAQAREIIGPTDSTTAPSGTIRGDFGTDKMRNICHASDRPETAAIEIQRFFSPEEIYRILPENS